MRDKVTISWYGYNGPFDVAKGTIVNAVPIDFTAATCLAKFISGLSTIDPDSPAESQVFWYLVSCTFWQFWGDVDGTRREIDACE